MADHGAAEVETGGVVDPAVHEGTYHAFLTLVKYATIGVAVILILMAFFLL